MPARDDRYEYVPWFKFYSREYLDGSMRHDCTLEERGIWSDLLSLANESRHRGLIQANNGFPYPLPWLANRLVIPLNTFEQALDKFKQQGRIDVTDEGILVLNFDFYQNLNTRRRGRPSKKGEHKDPDRFKPTLESRWREQCAVRFHDFRREHGRDASVDESNKIMDEVGREIIGESYVPRTSTEDRTSPQG